MVKLLEIRGNGVCLPVLFATMVFVELIAYAKNVDIGLFNIYTTI